MDRVPRVLVRLVAGKLSGARHIGILDMAIAVRNIYRWETLQPTDSHSRSMRGCDPVSFPLNPHCIVHIVDRPDVDDGAAAAPDFKALTG